MSNYSLAGAHEIDSGLVGLSSSTPSCSEATRLSCCHGCFTIREVETSGSTSRNLELREGDHDGQDY